MVKKLLFILASVLIGFMLITSSYYTCFMKTFQKFSGEVVEAGNYEEAGRYYSFAFDYANAFYKGPQEDGAHIDVYPALNVTTRTTTKEDKTSVTYETLEKCIQISIYHLPETFATADKAASGEEAATKGGVELVYGDKTVFFPFVIENKPDDVNDDESYYSYIEYYGYFPFTVYEIDYNQALTTAEIALDSKVDSLKIVDGNGEVKYELSLNASLFGTEFHSKYTEDLNAYNALRESNAITGETSTDELSALVNKVNQIGTDNQYQVQHKVDIITKSNNFRFRLGMIIGIFLALDFLLGFLLFRKKKPSRFVPRRPMPTAPTNGVKLNYQPEQFSRKDFIDAEEVVEENSKEETAE